MEQHPERIDEGIVRKDGSVTPWNAADVVGAVVDQFRLAGMPIPARYKAQIGKAAKGLLADGFDAKTLVLASAIAVRRAEPHNLHHIAMDLVLARGGMRMTRREYEQALQDEMEIGRMKR
jgi:hypothetical protein